MKIAKLWYLEQFNFMKKLERDEKMRLADTVLLESYHKNGEIIIPDEGNKNVYFLKKGVIKIGRVTDTGDEDLQYLIKEGSIFGELALAEGETRNTFAIAAEDCVICHVDAETMKKMMDQYPSLNTTVLKLIGDRVHRVERRLESILFKDSKARITEFIYDFMGEFGEPNEEGKIQVNNFLTNKDIAKLTATSRQTVNAVLNDLRKKGKLEFDTRVMSMAKSELLKGGQNIPVAE